MDSLLNLLRQNKTVNRLMNEMEFERLVKKHWSDIFGNMSDQIELVAIHDGLMIVSTENPIWLTELRHHEPVILANAAKIKGIGKKIKKIKIGVG